MQTGQQHDLPGHQAEVLALATAAGMLFSAGKDQSIRAWQFDAASGTFRPTVRTPTHNNVGLQYLASVLNSQPACYRLRFLLLTTPRLFL